MSLIRNRKLTKQQTRRIKKQQKQQQIADDDSLMDGVVVANFGKQLAVQAITLPKKMPNKPSVAEGEPEPFWQPITLHSIWRCHVRTNLPMLATGDKVRWTADPNTGLGRIEAVYDRRNIINRPDRFYKIKPIASNVDILAIVFACVPTPSIQLIDRYLVVCHHANIEPLLILNKADLIIAEEVDFYQNLLADYQKLGYRTLITQSVSSNPTVKSPINQNLATLSSLKNDFYGKTVIFAGQSGVGKSSLTNQLLPNANQAINDISTLSQLGQHTTTTSRLLPFDANDLAKGAIIDTPGIRGFLLYHLTAEEVLSGFIELAPLTEQCHFRDCKHTQSTPKCALWQAVKDGTVLARRVENLQLLQTEATQKNA